ncbi:hypothetical protein BGZ73_007986 [Actinomortierella ambigua]|nr:hypothetical protein BGZ73_007986 [Actinomortierella ambigua]
MLFKTTIIAALAAFAAMSAEAHVAVKEPCPRYGAYAGCPAPPAGQSVDYNIRAPIGVFGSANQPLCKHTKAVTKNIPTYKAGQTINVKFDIGAAHGGGHCQFALSYDGGKKWVVIKEIIRDCLRGNINPSTYSIPVKIPSKAPSGRVIVQWLWNNAIGARELYSNCFDIKIKGTNGGKVTGKEIVLINYGTKSHRVGEFPNPGDKDGRELFTAKSRKTVTITVPAAPKSKAQNNKPKKTKA